MKKLPLLLLTMSLVVCLEGCRSSLEMHGEQCSPVFVYTDESQTLIDAKQSFCNVRQYEMSLHKVGPVQGTSSKRPIHYCDRCMGFKDYSAWASFWEEVRRSLNGEDDKGAASFTRETR